MNIYIFITLLFITEYSISQLSQDSNQFERKYITGYDWNNVTLTLYSNNTYQLTSLWNVDMNEDEISKNSLIIWSSGKYNDSNETIICTNFIDLRKLILSKNSSSDIFKIVDSTDFHVLSNENNFHKGWEYKNDSIMFIGSLLDEDTLFYIHSESLSKKNEHDFKYILYRWENGEKRIVYQVSPNKDDYKYKLPWRK
ncbi:MULTISPECIES: hypothetical protein [unclassified Bacteroides]|jgi:hypothetical protein|uniref:hypothetical protein n=1 Tax=unclassified Bacteroides TaxID=2646097 RepID=UPI000E8545D6|nr:MULTISPECIES: hypothetical protein [unclassified Bacteroides]RGN47414.1 hypothetical protein DXB63_09560 [Bacteroides sp. OM05-12]RHR75038.1 hypothetical protein DWW69_11845 [Bacteroides sp. AF16-49]